MSNDISEHIKDLKSTAKIFKHVELIADYIDFRKELHSELIQNLEDISKYYKGKRTLRENAFFIRETEFKLLKVAIDAAIESNDPIVYEIAITSFKEYMENMPNYLKL